jgi:hypothetical protein
MVTVTLSPFSFDGVRGLVAADEWDDRRGTDRERCASGQPDDQPSADHIASARGRTCWRLDSGGALGNHRPQLPEQALLEGAER